MFEETILQVKQFMSETGKPLQAGEIAEHLGVTNSTAYGILDLMEVFGIVQRVKRGKYYYFLKGVYNDEQISAMLPPEKVKAIRVHKQRGRPRIPKPQPQDERDSFRKEYLADIKERTGSGEGLSALAILGLPQEEGADTLKTEPEPPVEMVLALMGEEEKATPPMRSRPFGTVSHLPKDFRRLTQGETSHLKSQLRGLDGYEEIDRFNTVFAKFNALERGRYGEEFYFSMGTNPWDNIRRVTVDPSLSDLRSYSRGQYDEILDKFLGSGHKLVEITVRNRDATYVKKILNTKIERRGLMDQVRASHVGEWIYLEKVE